MKRVCLIVDHPVRDLDGLVLVACELAVRGVETFLVPMYQRHEVFLLRPDLVVANYARFSSAPLLRACRRLGIRTAVLDTEGGVLQDVEAYAERMRPYLDAVDVYCTWGRRQREAIALRAPAGGTRVVMTGSPRYDFAVEPWLAAVPAAATDNVRIVLVNTNFPILGPRFQSSDREVRQLVGGMGYDADFIRRFIEQSYVARTAVVHATLELALAFPHQRFVLRPHPFEDRSFYERLVGGSDNVAVIQTGTVLEWIKPAAAVLHFSCSTAVESFLVGRPPIDLRWIDAPLLGQPVSVAVSLPAASPSQLHAMVAQALSGPPLLVPDEVRDRRRTVIEDYFGANDGRSASRVADVLEDAAGLGQPRHDSSVSYAIRTVTAQGDLRRAIQQIIALVAGAGAYERLRSLFGRTRVNVAKEFSADGVQEIAGRLASIHAAFEGIESVPARQTDSAVPVRWRYRSVRLRRAAPAS